VLDFETTGLKKPAVLEVAIVGPRGVIYEALVDPRQPIPPESTEVHGIAGSELAGAAPWPHHARALGAVLRTLGIQTVATWSGFEAEVLDFERERGAPELAVELVDLKRLYGALRGLPLPPPPRRVEGASLWQACAHYGLPPGTHRARRDCEATLAVWAAMQAEAGALAGGSGPLE
jgi:DNA polymerase III epsilon subunit-like protein